MSDHAARAKALSTADLCDKLETATTDSSEDHAVRVEAAERLRATIPCGACKGDLGPCRYAPGHDGIHYDGFIFWEDP